MGPVIVTWAPGTVAFEASSTMPPRLPRAAPWSCASMDTEKIMLNAKTELTTSHLLFIALDSLPYLSFIQKLFLACRWNGTNEKEPPCSPKPGTHILTLCIKTAKLIDNLSPAKVREFHDLSIGYRSLYEEDSATYS